MKVQDMNEEKLSLDQELLKMCGYDGTEILMNPHTGSVDTAENWACEASGWDDSYDDIYEQFDELIQI